MAQLLFTPLYRLNHDKMIEKAYKISTGNEKAVEKVIYDENLHYLHMVFNKDEGLPEHFSNSNVYMTVVRGTLSIGLNDQEIHKYSNGTLLKIPVNTKMNVKNLNDETLELIVVKAPAPTKYDKAIKKPISAIMLTVT